MAQIKLIIFDLDGTLVDAYSAIFRSFNYTMRKLNLPCRRNSVIRRAVGWGDENLLKPFVEEKALKKALLIYRRHHKISLLKYSRLFPGVAKLLAGLKFKGYKLAVASNRPTRFSRILIRHLGIEKYFDYALCSDRLKYGKPHPLILNRIIRRFSLKPQQALYVGDMVIDVQAGKRAKIKTIIVTTGSNTKKEVKKEKPYWIISRIRGLTKIL